MSSWESCSSLGSMKDKLELRLCVSVPLAHPPWVYGEGVADVATGHPLPTLVGLGGAWEAAGGGPMQGFGREAPLTRHITEQEQGVRCVGGQHSDSPKRGKLGVWLTEPAASKREFRP